MSKCLYCQDEIPKGMMVCLTCMNNIDFKNSYRTPSGDCRKCLHFNYCTDKGSHAYRGCGYFVDKDKYAEVVKCKDCKHCKKAFDGYYCCGRLRTSLLYVCNEDFCSYGERIRK